MNNRIKQLIEQAEIKFESHPQHQGIDTAVIIPTDLEKFTELIVRECTQSIENTIETDCITDGEKMGCEFAILDLLKHFGVEE
jgi:hypothetical protein